MTKGKEVAVNVPGWDEMIAEMNAQSASTGGQSFPQIKLAGKEGIYNKRVWNSETKEEEITSLGGGFQGVILAVRYEVRWKYSENATKFLYTNEFGSFSDDRITLTVKETGGAKSETRTDFADYSAFRDEYQTVDKGTGVKKSPYDLFVVLYVLTDGEIHKFSFKGSSRSSWFDHSNFLTGAPQAFLTEFGVSDPQTPKNAKPEDDVYYFVTFDTISTVPVELQESVIDGIRQLNLMFSSDSRDGAITAQIVEPEAPSALEEAFGGELA